MKNLIAILLLTLISCNSKEETQASTGLKPSLAAFVVADLELSTIWYQTLGFEPDTSMRFPDYGLEISFLKLGNFKLELIDFDEKYIIDKTQLPSPHSNIKGFIKLGFLTRDIEKVAHAMEAIGVEKIAGPDELPSLASGQPWPEKFFLVKDPDGNYVQFFETKEEVIQSPQYLGELKLAPFLAMLTVDDFLKAIHSYQQLGFKEIEKLEAPGNLRTILSNGNFVIELGSFESDVSLDELLVEDEQKGKVIRMSKLGFSSNHLDSLYQSFRGSEFDYYFEQLEGEEPFFILKDFEGNYIQVFGD